MKKYDPEDEADDLLILYSKAPSWGKSILAFLGGIVAGILLLIALVIAIL